MCHFRVFSKNHKILVMIETKVDRCRHFFLERAMRYMNGFRPIFGRFRTRRIFYRPQNCQNPQLKITKIMIFWNILKIHLKGFWYRFRVQNNSKTPQASISGHISCTRPPPAELSKIDFLVKIVILAILRHMWPCTFWPIICPEVVVNVIFYLKWLLWVPRMPPHTLDNLPWCVEQILKNHEKSLFLLYMLCTAIQSL